MKNSEIAAIVNAYLMQKDEVAKKRKNGEPVDEVKFPATVAWKRRVNLDRLYKANQLINEAIRDVQEKYSTDEYSEGTTVTDAEGNEKPGRAVKDEFRDAFIKEQLEVYEQDTEVKINKIKIGELEGLNLSEEDLDTLMFMIEEESDG